MLSTGLYLAATAAATGPSTTYAGSASGLWMSVLFPKPSGPLTYFDSGNLSASGGETDAPPITIHKPAATAEGLLSVATGLGARAEGQVALGYLDLLPGTPFEVTASFVMAAARATCSGVAGESQISGLRAGGRAIQVTGAPNQVVSVPGGFKLTIDEQIPSSGGLTVNALHLQTTLGTDAIVSSAYSAVSCHTTGGGAGVGGPGSGGIPVRQVGFQPARSCADFTTGGGWINSTAAPVTSSTFGFVAGFTDNKTNPRGSFGYRDHTLRLTLNALDVLYYGCGSNPGSREFGGDAQVNRASGYCYEVIAHESGGPGRGTDHLAVTVWGPTSSPCPTSGPPPAGSEAAYPKFFSEANPLGGGSIEIQNGALP